MSAFGPRDAPLIFKDVKSQLSIDPEIENGMLADGFEVRVSPFDDDAGHLPSHLEAMKEGGDPTGAYRVHILMHQMSMAQKAQAAAQPQGQPGMPGGAGPGTPGQSPPGAQPQGPQVNRGPPGMIRPDAMPAAGAVGMPRRT
jgi:hypothetical protein